MIHGAEPTKVLLQCRTIRLIVAAKIKTERAFLWVRESAYICPARAIGATHHFPTGSKAAERSAPESAESKSATNPMH
jgi:hypothetical protein